MDGRATDLLGELRWQISECDAARSGQHVDCEAAASPVYTIGTEGDDYAPDLRDLRNRIQNSVRSGSDTEGTVPPLPHKPPLWKLLTFCRPSGRFVDPLYVRERLRALIEVSRRGVPSTDGGSWTQDIWANRHVERWITSDQPSMLFLEALHATAPRARQFALELTAYLKKFHPVACMLGGLPPSITDEILPNLTPEAVLEQLTIQALRCATVDRPLPFLLNNLRLFKEAKGCDDWFSLLRKTCEKVPKISVVVDLAMVPIRFQDDIRNWPLEFHRIGEELAKGPAPKFFQVLFLGPRRLFAGHHDIGSVVAVGDAPESEHRYTRPATRKRPVPRPVKAPEPPKESQTSPLSAVLPSAPLPDRVVTSVECSAVPEEETSLPPFQDTASIPNNLVEPLKQAAEDPVLSASEASDVAPSHDYCTACPSDQNPSAVCSGTSATGPDTSSTSKPNVLPNHIVETQGSSTPRSSTLATSLGGCAAGSMAHVPDASSQNQAPSVPNVPTAFPAISAFSTHFPTSSAARESSPHTRIYEFKTTSRKRPPEPPDLRDDAEAPCKDRYQIKIALVCALPLEADAVRALFDEHWRIEGPMRFRMRSTGDINAYSFGVIGGHPAVLVHMPGMGKGHGAMVATNLRTSFPNVKLALVVGICGGVPFYDRGRREVVLGDVVVSEGIKHVDFGRRYPGQFVTREAAGDVFGRPPPEIRGQLAKLKSKYDREMLRKRMSEHLQTLKRELGDEAEYPGAANDQVYEGTYIHRHNESDACRTCSNRDDGSYAVCEEARGLSCKEVRCDDRRLVPRKRLEAIINGEEGADPSPAVHFGYIACADHVMKSGEDRDNIARDAGVIAFEMEGAGVWDMFPCLVIKAVCDYADSHKNKKWQNYAAATAAAYAKAFLEEWYM